MKKYNILNRLVIVFAVLAMSCGKATDSLPYYEDASFTPHWLSKETSGGFHSIPDFSLINQFGDSITGASLRGKIYVADFFFTTCPGICPKMTDNMCLVQDSFLEDNEVQILSFSVTPEIDSVSVLKAYAERKNVISKNWHLLTGNRDIIYDLGRKSYFVEEDLGVNKSNDDFLHTENFVLIDQQGHIRGIYNGLNKASVNQLIQDIHLLKN